MHSVSGSSGTHELRLPPHAAGSGHSDSGSSGTHDLRLPHHAVGSEHSDSAFPIDTDDSSSSSSYESAVDTDEEVPLRLPHEADTTQAWPQWSAYDTLSRIGNVMTEMPPGWAEDI